ncbi:MAG: phosphonate ABC transporter, permease protein PhnE, partial [Alphaproteobacteria bacterium]|nr:phosphonate ABC transporter, permease protein PhnE [Alphaproteobacteria bacterium]
MARPGATLPPLPPKPANLFPVWSGLLIALFVVITRDLEITFEDLFWGLADMAEFLGRFDHPDFTELPRYLRLMGETLAMAAWGTALSLAIAVVAAPFAARNLSPSPIIYRIVREALNLLRAIPDLLLALIFVAALGLGPLAGTLALGLHTAGFLGKFFAECLERVDPGAYEAA